MTPSHSSVKSSPYTDHTHDPERRSWLESANDPAGDFPIQNLPYGVFRRAESKQRPRMGVAIGEFLLDLAGAEEHGLFSHLSPPLAAALSRSSLNLLMGLGHQYWKEAREAISHILEETTAVLREDDGLRNELLISQRDVQMQLPATIGDYTDFYASVHHATNVGSMFRPENPLLPNYKHLPVGYHGRASSVVVSGTDIRRPCGQTKADDDTRPSFGPCRLLDYELEMGFFVGPSNEIGRRITMVDAPEHIFGLCLVNDWSARDVQKWEYQPLGPFNAKNFATTISPWLVTLDALAPYRVPGPPRSEGDPETLDYLKPVDDLGLEITVEAYLQSEAMRERGMDPVRLSRGGFDDMYWTIGQMLTHHTSTGCPMRPGDLLASGTVSGPSEDARGCLLELTWRGQQPIELPDGTPRRFLQDGDEVTLKAYAEREGAVRIGFGECRGRVAPAEE